MNAMGLPILAAIVVIVVVVLGRGIRVVPQQSAWVVERLGRFYAVLNPGLNLIIPLIDRVAYKHVLKEVPFNMQPQVCITKDNTQVEIDGNLYYQVTDPKLASYGATNYEMAIVQLAQTSLRSEVGKRELDRLLEERTEINHAVIQALDAASLSWGVKVLRYEIRDITPPETVLNAMQKQITAEREKRAVIATSEGQRQTKINVAEGEKEAAIRQSEGAQQAAINRAQGDARAITLMAEATAEAITRVATAIRERGGLEAVNLRVAEQYVGAFGQLAKQGNTLIVPGNFADMAGMVAAAMRIVQGATGDAVAAPAERP